MPKGVISYMTSTRFYHNEDKSKWYTKLWKTGGVWEIIEFSDFEVARKYVSSKSDSKFNKK